MKQYEFTNGGYDVRINRMDTPYPWVNYLTNTKLSAMLSQAGGGYLWYKSPHKLRITRYRYYQLPPDTPGFYIYIKEENGEIWCPTFQPMQDAKTQRHAVHRPGESRFYASHGDTEAVLSLFIPSDVNALIWDVTLQNKSGVPKQYEVYAYAELSQFGWGSELNFGYYWQHMLRTSFDWEHETLFYSFHYASDDYHKKTSPLVYFASDRRVSAFCGDRDAFVGNYRSEVLPVALERDRLLNEEIASGNPCAALQVSLTVGAGLCEPVHFFLGLEEGALTDYARAREAALQSVASLRSEGRVVALKQELDARYAAHFDRCRCELPQKDVERQINIWGPLNALQFSLFHQTPQPSAPGTRMIGARDKLQALMPMVYRNVVGVTESFLFMLANQYANGALAHNIGGYMNEWSTPGKFNRAGLKSDDHLWAPYLAYAIAAESDTSFLERTIPFFEEDGKTLTEPAPVWEHLMRLIEWTESNLGAHGLPLMLDGDWNDIISRFSHKGKGESVFAAQQYAVALEKMIALAKATDRKQDAARMECYRKKLCDNLLQHAWNGEWWYRCFDDDGNPIGSRGDTFGKLWLNPQSWAVLSGVGSDAQNAAAFDAVEHTLDTGYGLKLLDPGFQTYPEVSEPFSPYNPGTGENGAVFCHAHAWAIIAEAKRKNAEKAWKYYEDLLPFRLHECLGTETYRSDPYGWVSNIVGPENSKHGWGNVIRLTGTSVWMNIAATQYLLGVRTCLDGLKIDPCIPADWESYCMERDYLGCRLHIRFSNPNRVSSGVRSIFADGVEQAGNVLPRALFEGKERVELEVLLGR